MATTERERKARRLAAAYRKGQSVRALAAAEGMSYGYVHRLLVESGVSFRPRGGAHR